MLLPMAGRTEFTTARMGWKLPQQSIQILLNANRFDLVINNDGFNEHYVVKGDSNYLEMPCPNNRTVSPLGFHHQAALVGLWAAGALTRGVEKTPGGFLEECIQNVLLKKLYRAGA